MNNKGYVNMDDIKELILFLKLLADETRLRIIHLLISKEITVGDLCAVLEMSQSSISKHLVKLRLMGVVNDVRDGSFVYYSLNDQNEKYIQLIRFVAKNYGHLDIFQQDLSNLNEVTKID